MCMGLERDIHADVGIRLPAAVKAISIAVFMDVIFAPSIRVKERRWVCASTTAMLLNAISALNIANQHAC
jgi:hypothetical protein